MSQVVESTKSKGTIKSNFVNSQSLPKNASEISITCDSFYEIPVFEMPAKRETDKRY
jgi:hypothetical protein